MEPALRSLCDVVGELLLLLSGELLLLLLVDQQPEERVRAETGPPNMMKSLNSIWVIC